jgi:hypothetical protein
VNQRIIKPAVCAATAAVVLAAGPAASASGEVGFGVSYDARLPVGSFRRVVTKPAWQGFQATLDYFISDTFSIGVGGQYSLFQQNFSSQTIGLQNGALTSEVFKAASIWSLFATVHAYLWPHAVVRPYVALGVGPTDVIHTLLASDVAMRDEKWFLMAQPSAGAFYRIGPDPVRGLRDDPAIGLAASVSYALTTANLGNASDLSYFGVQVGVYSKY